MKSLEADFKSSGAASSHSCNGWKNGSCSKEQSSRTRQWSNSHGALMSFWVAPKGGGNKVLPSFGMHVLKCPPLFVFGGLLPRCVGQGGQ